MRTDDYTEADLLRVAIALIEMNGSTTTLDVKEALRKKGFWATQPAVSANMHILAEAGKLQHDDGLQTGLHRTYTAVDHFPAPSNTAVQSQNIVQRFLQAVDDLLGPK